LCEVVDDVSEAPECCEQEEATPDGHESWDRGVFGENELIKQAGVLHLEFG
jgi:hypothetical protein